ncbi:MAG TPA: hypothetical protein VM388_14470 [Acidimicrobiales bacterium]|jgi:hypothetical protein|nr:hypothetical protein [Acidimicrobiales bacterium]
MAELPELRTHALPERLPEPRQLYDRAHTYGVAHDLERMRQGFGPAARTPRTPSRYGRRLGLRRSRTSDVGWLAGVWHRLRCRTGHHDVRGGGQMQLGSRYVLIERRCIWCDAPPPAL